MVSGLMFESLNHFEFIFVYGVRKCSSFILLQVVDQLSQHHLLKRLSFLHCIFLAGEFLMIEPPGGPTGFFFFFKGKIMFTLLKI